MKPQKPIQHINPPTTVPNNTPIPKPGTIDPKLPQEQQWPYAKPKKKPK